MKRVLVFLLFLFCLTGCESGVSADFSRPTEATPLSLVLELNDRTIHSEFQLYTDVKNSVYGKPDKNTAAEIFGSGKNALDLSLIEHYAIRSATQGGDEVIIIALKEERGAENVKAWMSSRFATRGKGATEQNSLINQKGKFIFSVLCNNAPSVGSLIVDSISAAYSDQ